MIVQTHHISHDPEITVRVSKGEHRILSLMEWYTRKTVSKGFIKALRAYLALNEDRAVEI
jgi:hypothetical protein